MVVLSKILPLLAAGVGIFFLVNAITRPAHAQQTAGALSSTFGTLGSAGSGVASLGEGIGSGLAGLFKPVWEITNLFERFSNLSSGAANISPVAQGAFQPSAPTWTVSQGGSIIHTSIGDSKPKTDIKGRSSGGANISSLGSQRASGGGFRAAN